MANPSSVFMLAAMSKLLQTTALWLRTLRRTDDPLEVIKVQLIASLIIKPRFSRG